MSNLVPRARSGTVTAADIAKDLERFEDAILDQLDSVGLPTDGLLVEIDERHTLLSSLGGALRRLPADNRSRSLYVSKMIVAGAVGLFDAALNYLWDETVNELRRRVVGYDLGYFYDIAVSGDMRRHFGSAEDLPRVQDSDLLRACREIGLLSDVGYTEIDHVRYMRNHASAAHPNQNELTGLQLAAWLETCIRQVITLPQDPITANTGRLLANIKATPLDTASVAATASFFDELPSDRADTLAAGFFGLYTDLGKRTTVIADNVLRLWPGLWEYISDEARNAFGIRYGRLQANAETDKATAARELIDLVDGAEYLPEQTRAVEIDAALDTLLSAHNGYDNFYNEVAPARTLENLVGAHGRIPDAVATKYVRVLVQTYLGNGYGVSNGALASYENLLGALSPRQAGWALRAFANPEISSQLWSSTGQRQWNALLGILEPKLTGKIDRALFDAINGFPGTPDKLRLDTEIARLARVVVIRRSSASRRT